MRPVSISDAEHYVWGDGCDGWHLVKRDDLSIIQERVPPGTSEELHFHRRSRQFFYVLEGEATFRVGDRSLTLRRFEGLEVAPNVPHNMRNESGRDVVFLVISSPKSHGDREVVHE